MSNVYQLSPLEDKWLQTRDMDDPDHCITPKKRGPDEKGNWTAAHQYHRVWQERKETSRLPETLRAAVTR
jgi:hypothetical protein